MSTIQRMLDFDGRFRTPEHPELLAAVREWEDAVVARQQQLGADDPRTVDGRLHLVEAYENLGSFLDGHTAFTDVLTAGVCFGRVTSATKGGQPAGLLVEPPQRA